MGADQAKAYKQRWAFRLMRDVAATSRSRVATAAMLVAAGAVFESLGLVLIVPLLGVVFGPSTGWLGRIVGALFAWAGAETQIAKLALLLTLLGLVMTVRAIVLSFRDITLTKLQHDFLTSLRTGVMERLANAAWEQIVRLRHARITSLMGGDMQRVAIGLHFMLQLGVAVMLLVAQAVLALLLAPGLAVAVIVMLMIGALSLGPLIRRTHDLGSHIAEANLSLMENTSQVLGGLKLAISQDLQAGFVAGLKDTLDEVARREIDHVSRKTRGQIATAVLSSAGAAALVLAGIAVFHVAPQVLIALLLIFARMNGPANQAQAALQQIAYAAPVYERLKLLEDELIPALQRSVPKSLPNNAAIIFEDVKYSHGGSASPGVHCLDLTISPHEFIGIGGPSGAGKTTFADLLVGLIRPQAGRITMGGVGLDASTLCAWRARLAYVSQDAYLFHDSLRRNLSWSSAAADEDEMWRALDLVGASDFVRQLPEGLDTLMGERGTLVSGGERQRLALARALLRRPQLLVLDEATNAIDLAGEQKLLQGLAALSVRPTIVLISHRPESLLFCDRVFLLEAGRIVQQRFPASPVELGQNAHLG